ncbi:MAG: polymer-forming cytoskeletal protein [Bacteriovoracaceae bacterium]
MKDQDFKTFHYNVLGLKSKIIGDIILSGDTILTSVIEGSITVLEGKLTLERGSSVKGKIVAPELEIFGLVDGEIECSGLTSIRSSAEVLGTVKSGRLVIYPGAVVQMNASSQEI